MLGHQARVGHAGPDHQLVALAVPAGELRDAGQVEDPLGPAAVEVELDHQVGAAGDRQRPGVGRARGERVGEVPWLKRGLQGWEDTASGARTPDARRRRGRRDRPHDAVADRVTPGRLGYGSPMTDYAITYGKASVPVYRHHAAPLAGLAAVPESVFTGRSNALFAALVTVEVFGDNFLPSYTEADNSMVVATDSMKNLVLRETGSWTGATMESLLHHLGVRLLTGYPQMEAPADGGRGDPLRPGREREAPCSRACPATARWRRCASAARATATAIDAVESGRHGMALLKLTGSAFTAFVRDGYTTLPERRDRPLYIALDVDWRYVDPADALGGDPPRYVAGEQVRDVCAAVFEDLVSESIQHLVHAMGERAARALPRPRLGLVHRAEHDPRPRGGGRLHRPLQRLRHDHPDHGPVSGRLTTHVLDTAAGRPAAGIPVTVHRDGDARRRGGHRRRRPHRRPCWRATPSRPASTS